jgi:UDP-N-acetylmuramyl pentapeptide phosphotransferase/UDP-N-acetylglucosamine-1-phosphate transferase
MLETFGKENECDGADERRSLMGAAPSGDCCDSGANQRRVNRCVTPAARALRASAAQRPLLALDPDAARRRNCDCGRDGAWSFLPASAVGIISPAILLAAVVLIAAVGIMADIHPIAVTLRLLLQALAVAMAIYTLPVELRVLPILPWWIERVALIVGGLWFVNLVNFMDGLDWMTVAEVVPITAALAAIGVLGILPPQATIISLALCGAMIGFAFFNRPVAKLFLGDVGSLPIGLSLGWLLVLVAGNGGRAAAILLPLYYLADSSLTLARRLMSGEQVWQPHRSHFYQRATDRGFRVIEVVARVFFVNLVLAALALATVLKPSRELDIAALGAGIVLVAWLLIDFSRGRR